jgi:predicted DNA binding CopG/RHH family protein
MPTKSTNKKPQFKSEAEEADWYHTPEGKRHVSHTLRKAIRKGTIVVEEKVSMQRALELARSGKRIVLRQGVKIKATDPAVLQKLVEEALASMTQAVSLRIPVVDLDTAKAIAEKKGVGYQSVLKQATRDGLRHGDG